ncbi:PAS domain S-box protein [Aurantivibrio plasticivorans]
MRKLPINHAAFIIWFCSLAATIVGSAVMLGWWLQIPRLIQLQPAFSPMQFNTALCIVLLGASTFFSLFKRSQVISSIFAATSFLIASITLVQYFALIDLGIDQLFKNAYLTTASLHPGRMAGNTAACICLISAAIILRSSELVSIPNRSSWIAGITAAALGISSAAFVGYLTTIFGPIGWGTGTYMTAHGAGSLSLVSIALLILTWRSIAGFKEFRITLMATVAPFTIMVGFAIFFQLRDERSSGLKQIVEHDTQILQIAIINSLDDLSNCIDRNSELWADLDGDRETYWRNYTHALLADHNEFNSIEWIKPDKTIGWAEPETTSSEHVGFNFASNEKVSNALDLAKDKGTLYSNLVYSPIIGQSVLLLSPIYQERDFKGWILARIDMNRLLDSFTPLTNRLGIAAQIQQQHGTTLTKAIDIDPFFASTETLNIPGQTWELVVTPTPSFFSFHHRPLSYVTTMLVFISGVLIIWLMHILLKGAQRSRQLTLLHNRLDGAVNALMDGLIIVNSSGVILDINDTAATMLGYLREDLIGKNVVKLAPIAADAAFIQKIEAQFAEQHNSPQPNNGLSTTVRGMKRSGKEVPLEAKISRGIDDGKIFYTVVIRDLSEQLATQEKLAEHEAMLRAAIENSPVAMAITDAQGNYIDINNAFCRWLGYDKDEIIGRSFLDLVPEETREERRALFDRLLIEPNEVMLAEKRYLRKDGEVVWGYLAASPVLNNKGEITHIAAQILDIQEEKRLKEALEDQNQELSSINQELNQFAYIASHDLKEPLRTMRTFSKYLLKDLQNGDTTRINEDIEFINSASERMTRLIDDLLQLSRVSNKTLEFSDVNLNDCMDNIVAQLDGLIKETNANVAYDHLPIVRGDDTQLASVFLNLVNNAIKFHKPGSTPQVNITRLDENTKGMCTLVIEDNGIGIQQDKTDEIFGAFKKLHAVSEYDGTGIGLAIVKKVIERHNGRISVDSLPDRGTRFTINLQLAQQESSIAHAS